MADAGTYARGERYHREGRVLEVETRGSALVALVRGTDRYRAKLWVKGDGLAYDCSCPLGAEGTFCKHLVASALAHLGAESRLAGTAPFTPAAPADETAMLAAALEAASKESLVAFLLAEAARDAGLRRALGAWLGRPKP